MADNWVDGGFAIYIHWPFCEAKCPYCDFNSHVSARIDHEAWTAAYVEELQKAAELTPGRTVRSIFFGGGTPSLMRPATVAAVIDTVQRHWRVTNDIEITLEANPSSVEADAFAGFRSAGINRISMGIQALNDPDLKRLGRLHTTNEALAAFDIARTTFDRVSFDLIYGRQDQTLAQWTAELDRALGLAVDHLSLYQLTIEQGTAFGDRYAAGRLRGLPDEDLSADMYGTTQEICEAHGLSRYEVSNHARPGAESRHNLVYWKYGDYVGIGPGAHGRLTLPRGRVSTEQTRAPSAWLSGRRNLPEELLSAEEQAQEYLLMGLRLTEGVDLQRYERIAGQELDRRAVTKLEEDGLILRCQKQLMVQDQGFRVLNYILRTLIID